MDIESARNAGAIAKEMDALSQAIMGLNRLVENGARISGKFGVIDTVTGQDWAECPTLSVEDSVVMLNAAAQMFQARLDALSASLASL